LCLDLGIRLFWHALPAAVFVDSWLHPWLILPLLCGFLGFLVGVSMKLMGEPCANLAGTVKEFKEHGKILRHDLTSGRMIVVSLLSVCGGGSLGPEAPIVALGGGLADILAGFLDFGPAEGSVAAICGMGAGLAVFFDNALGGALFACEVLHRFGLEMYEAILPALTASLVAQLSSRAMSGHSVGPSWHFPHAANPSNAWWLTLLGVLLGLVGGLIGLAWIRCASAVKGKLAFVKSPIIRATVGGTLVGCIGMLLPETMFWGELEAQTIIDLGASKLPHVRPTVGVFGSYPLALPGMLVCLAVVKLATICITNLAGYRGGLIFPLMFVGICLGQAFCQLVGTQGLLAEAVMLGLAAALNVAVTRTPLSTPLVLSTLGGQEYLLPCMLMASIVSLHVSAASSFIVAASPRQPTLPLQFFRPSPTVERDVEQQSQGSDPLGSNGMSAADRMQPLNSGPDPMELKKHEGVAAPAAGHPPVGPHLAGN